MAQSAIARGQQAAVGQVRTQDWGAPSDLWAAQSAERARVLRGFQRDAADAAIAGRSDKMAKAGSACVDALMAFGTAIDEASSDFDTPAALQQDVDITDLHRQAQCEQELLALADQAMPRGLMLLEQAIKHGKVDRLKNLVPALVRAANQILMTPPPKLMGPRASHYAKSLYDSPSQDGPHAAAHRVLKAIRAWRESQRPESIAIAMNILQRTRPIFAALAGKDAPQFMTTDQILSRARGGDAAHKGDPWEIDTSWPFRYLPPSPVTLPGWSPVTGWLNGRKTGIPIRQPAPLVNAEVRLDDEDEVAS
jgi:hypothetical protein